MKRRRAGKHGHASGGLFELHYYRTFSRYGSSYTIGAVYVTKEAMDPRTLMQCSVIIDPPQSGQLYISRISEM